MPSGGPRRPLGQRGPVAGGTDVRLPGSGITLAATVWSGTGVPVVLLHGLASQRRFWDLVVRRLAEIPVLAVDARGHGDSDQPLEGYGLAEVADEAAGAIRAAGLGPACVVGHSWGGAVALTLAARHPDLAVAVVAIDGGFTDPTRGEARDVVRRRLEPPRLALPATELPAMLARGPLARWWSPEVEAALLPIFAVDEWGTARARLPFERHMDVVDGMLDLDLDALLPQVRCPAWLVSCEPGGVTDPAAVEWAAAKAAGLERARELMTDVRALRWVGALHDVPLQWPDLVAGLIRSARADSAAADLATGSGRTAE